MSSLTREDPLPASLRHSIDQFCESLVRNEPNDLSSTSVPRLAVQLAKSIIQESYSNVSYFMNNEILTLFFKKKSVLFQIIIRWYVVGSSGIVMDIS